MTDDMRRYSYDVVVIGAGGSEVARSIRAEVKPPPDSASSRGAQI